MGQFFTESGVRVSGTSWRNRKDFIITNWGGRLEDRKQLECQIGVLKKYLETYQRDEYTDVVSFLLVLYIQLKSPFSFIIMKVRFFGESF